MAELAVNKFYEDVEAMFQEWNYQMKDGSWNSFVKNFEVWIKPKPEFDTSYMEPVDYQPINLAKFLKDLGNLVEASGQ